MFRFAICIVFFAGTAVSARADDEADTDVAPKSFVVEVTHLVAKDTASQSAVGLHGAPLEKLLQGWRDAEQIISEESLSLTSIEHQESTVQFGRRVAVVTGTTSIGPGRTTSNISWENVGTLVRARVSSRDEGVVVKLEYESSAHEPADDDTPRPGLGTTTLNTEIGLALGERHYIGGLLVAGSQGDRQSVVLIRVAQVEANEAPVRSSRIAPPAPRRSPPRASTPPRPSFPGGNVSPSANSSAERFAKFADALFGRYDTNNDGFIDASDDGTLRGGIAAFDENKDGKVSRKEFIDYHTRRFPMRD